MKIETVQTHLMWLGFGTAVDGDLGTKTKQAVSNFQRGFSYWDLAVDGEPGAATAKALAHAASGPRRQEGTASAHFSFSEFACKCNGRYKSCQRIRADRDTVRGLEAYRDVLGTGVAILSGYRCPDHNRAVAGATRSRHIDGDAVDLQPVLAWRKVKAMGIFTGIGYQGTTGKVRHVDTRIGNLAAPTVWQY